MSAGSTPRARQASRRSWDAFAALEPRCGSEPPPPAQGQHLGAELLRLREAFAP